MSERVTIEGRLNQSLIKPMSPYFSSSLYGIGGGRVFGIIMLLSSTSLVVLFGNYSNYMSSALIFIFGILYFVVTINLIISTVFYLYKVKPIMEILFEFMDINKRFTPQLFSSFFFALFLFLLPNAIYTFFVVEALKGRFELFFQYIFEILVAFILMVILNIIIWNKGLKRYEAFG